MQIRIIFSFLLYTLSPLDVSKYGSGDLSVHWSQHPFSFASVALSVRCFDNYYKFLPTLWLNMSTQTVFRTFSVREQNDKREEIEQLLVSLVCRRG